MTPPKGPPEPEALSRRTFLARATAWVGALITLVLGGTGTGYFLSPVFRKEAEEWVDVGPAESVPMRRPFPVEFVQRRRDAWAAVEKRSTAWVLTPDGKEFLAFDPRCTHLGCPYRWDDEKRQFLCPCHAAAFGMDGRVLSGPPPRPLDRYPAKVVEGRLLLLPTPERRPA